MKYMKVGPRDNSFLVGQNGLPYNYSIYAYADTKERQAALDKIWSEGGNGMFCTRKEVENCYGKNFEVSKDGFVCFDASYENYLIEEREAHIKAGKQVYF